jgi:hypothetical protein
LLRAENRSIACELEHVHLQRMHAARGLFGTRPRVNQHRAGVRIADSARTDCVLASSDSSIWRGLLLQVLDLLLAGQHPACSESAA